MNTPKNPEMGTTEGEIEMTTETPDTILVPSTPKQRRSYTAVAVTIAALAIGGLGGVVWQQHTQRPTPVTVAVSPETPRTVGDLAPERIDGSASIKEHEKLVQQHADKIGEIAEEWGQKITTQDALFDARCAAAGGDTLYSNERRCTVDLPALPAVPSR